MTNNEAQQPTIAATAISDMMPSFETPSKKGYQIKGDEKHFLFYKDSMSNNTFFAMLPQTQKIWLRMEVDPDRMGSISFSIEANFTKTPTLTAYDKLIETDAFYSEMGHISIFFLQFLHGLFGDNDQTIEVPKNYKEWSHLFRCLQPNFVE